MGARVFVSCGQREGERDVARAVADWFTSQGFRPYVALEAQSIQDVNSGIIGELRRSDYYVFIDLKRERLDSGDGSRGSLFSHQELAIAYALGFENAIFFREIGVQLEGLGAFMIGNATLFQDRTTVPHLVADAARRRGWSPEYSRNFIIGPLRWSDQPIRYRDLQGRFLYVDIQNRRPEVAAAGTIARLAALQLDGDSLVPSPNRSPLKVTGQSVAFQQTIWPHDRGSVDLLCVDVANGARVYLNNALDVCPTPPLLERPGTHSLHYEVFAPGFDVLPFCLRLRTTANCSEAEAEIVPEGEGVA